MEMLSAVSFLKRLESFPVQNNEDDVTSTDRNLFGSNDSNLARFACPTNVRRFFIHIYELVDIKFMPNIQSRKTIIGISMESFVSNDT